MNPGYHEFMRDTTPHLLVHPAPLVFGPFVLPAWVVAYHPAGWDQTGPELVGFVVLARTEANARYKGQRRYIRIREKESHVRTH